MGFKLKDLTNQKYGRLTVIEFAEVKNRNAHWLCRCECGNLKVISACGLKFGTKSCGCLFKEKMQGSSNPAWKGGVVPDNKKERNSELYAQWRTYIFTRDNYTCQKCNVKGKVLHSHHIENFASNITQRFDPNNGVTLCKTCHLTFHKLYGKTNNNSTQLKEYLT